VKVLPNAVGSGRSCDSLISNTVVSGRANVVKGLNEQFKSICWDSEKLTFGWFRRDSLSTFIWTDVIVRLSDLSIEMDSLLSRILGRTIQVLRTEESLRE
jgi:hypothetical protein